MNLYDKKVVRFVSQKARSSADARIHQALHEPRKADLAAMLRDAVRNTAALPILAHDKPPSEQGGSSA